MSKSEDTDKLKKLLTTYLETHNKLEQNQNGELEIKFGTRGIKKITKNTFDNVIQQLLSQNFELKEESVYYLNIKTDTIRTSINGLKNIHEYCRTNNIYSNIMSEAYTFMEKKPYSYPSGTSSQSSQSSQSSPSFINFDDFNFRTSYSIETTYSHDSELIINLLKKWNNEKKFYRLINRYTMVHKDYPVVIDLSIVRESQKSQSNLKESNIFGLNGKYEIEIEVNNKLIDGKMTAEMLDKILKKITKFVLSGLQGTNYPVSYSEQNIIAQNYLELVKGTRSSGSGMTATLPALQPQDFIGPSSTTLQINNIAPINDESNVINIQKNYTVTDKADGDRKMLYVSNNGKIYLITTLMEIEFTGAQTKNGNLFNSLLDGEHIKHNKHHQFINLYAAFDIYYINKRDIRELLFSSQTVDNIATNFRLPLLANFIKELNAVLINSTKKSPIIIQKKTFYQNFENQTIFNACKLLQSNILENQYVYETDGFIFTPSNLGVGCNKQGDRPKNYKHTWNYSMKWKPAKYNTIDFLITTKKLPSGLEYTGNIFESGMNTKVIDQIVQYKTIVLRVGFDESKHGYINPCENIFNDVLPIIEDIDNEDTYKPVQFFPSDPYDIDAGITNIELKLDNTNTKQMFSENGEIIEDSTIVEFRYDFTKPKQWRWIPLRVRYDKTAEYRSGHKNYGNAYHVAQSNWHSINNPVTIEMLTTGENIRTEVADSEVADSDIYYNTKSGLNYTKSLRDYHNLYVKNKLILSVSNPGDTLIDYAVGKGGDISKWIAAKLSFIFGIDLSKDNIQNRIDGACARYLNYYKKFKIIPNALFIHGNSSQNIRNTSAIYTEKGKLITKAIFGEGSKEQMSFLGKGVLKSFGKGAEGFNISSIQFAIHYMFDNVNTLHNFLTNITECTKLGGYFIGTCYNGKEIFKLLRDKQQNESVTFMDREQKNKLLEITKLYDMDEFPDSISSLGYGINVFQESINKTFQEFLVNYDYLTSVLENYGFVPLSKEECAERGLVSSIGNFRDLFALMTAEIKKYPLKANEYGNAYKMTKEQKDISFLNNYFIFKKVRNVDINDVKIGLLQYSDEEQLKLTKESLLIKEKIEEVQKEDEAQDEDMPIEIKKAIADADAVAVADAEAIQPEQVAESMPKSIPEPIKEVVEEVVEEAIQEVKEAVQETIQESKKLLTAKEIKEAAKKELKEAAKKVEKELKEVAKKEEKELKEAAKKEDKKIKDAEKEAKKEELKTQKSLQKLSKLKLVEE